MGPSLHCILNLTTKTCCRMTNESSQCRKLYACCAVKSTLRPGILLLTTRQRSDSPPKCWKCNYPRKSVLFCSKCKTLQELPENLNYFDVIGVKQRYDVENAEVQKKYRQLQNVLHPDRFSNSTEKERKISENLSSLVNKAYSTLVHPLDRGLYMLRLNNLSIPEGSTSMDPEFLMEIMERNEEVEKASTDQDQVIRIMAENRQKLAELSDEVSEAFRQNNVEKAKTILVKMKYYASIDAKLKALKQDLGIVD